VEDAAHQRAEQDERERFRVWDARRLEREGQRERRRLRLPRHHRPKGGPHVGPHELHRLAEALDRKVAANVRRLHEGSRRQVGSAAVGEARRVGRGGRMRTSFALQYFHRVTFSGHDASLGWCANTGYWLRRVMNVHAVPPMNSSATGSRLTGASQPSQS
jgi:hypothetical protein